MWSQSFRFHLSLTIELNHISRMYPPLPSPRPRGCPTPPLTIELNHRMRNVLPPQTNLARDSDLSLMIAFNILRMYLAREDAGQVVLDMHRLEHARAREEVAVQLAEL